MIRICKNWWELLTKAWSIRWLAIAVVLSGLEVGFGFFANDPPIRRGVFAALSALTSGFAFCARLIAQKSFSEKENDQ